MDLTTAQFVNARRGRDSADDATLINSLITEVSADVALYLRRHVQAVARTQVYTLPYGIRDFRLDGYPVASISSVSTSPDLDFSSSEILSVSSYYLEPAVGRLRLVSPTAFDPTFVQVVYTGGMAADTTAFRAAYPDIAGAVESAVLELLKRADKPGVSETRLRDGGVSYERPVNMLPLLKRRLDQHRRTVIL